MSMTRRSALAGLGSLAALGVLGRGAAAQEATPQASPATGAWTFTDDAGKTVTLPQAPKVVVADLNAASALWDFGVRPVAISGWTVDTDAAWGNIDRSTPNITANVGAPEPDIEKLLTIKPDLFVTITWGPEEISGEAPYAWSFTDNESYERVNAIAPVVGISATGQADDNMASFAHLAELLGADLNTPELVEAKATFDERVATFSEVAQEKADLTTLFGSASADQFYVASPRDWADLSWYQKLGMNIIEPDVPPLEYWEALSIEQAGKYQPDVFFQSARAGSLTKENLETTAPYDSLAAVKAGQVAPWNQDFIQSYQGLAAALEIMITALTGAKKVTG